MFAYIERLQEYMNVWATFIDDFLIKTSFYQKISNILLSWYVNHNEEISNRDAIKGSFKFNFLGMI